MVADNRLMENLMISQQVNLSMSKMLRSKDNTLVSYRASLDWERKISTLKCPKLSLMALTGTM